MVSVHEYNEFTAWVMFLVPAAVSKVSLDVDLDNGTIGHINLVPAVVVDYDDDGEPIKEVSIPDDFPGIAAAWDAYDKARYLSSDRSYRRAEQGHCE